MGHSIEMKDKPRCVRMKSDSSRREGGGRTEEGEGERDDGRSDERVCWHQRGLRGHGR